MKRRSGRSVVRAQRSGTSWVTVPAITWVLSILLISACQNEQGGAAGGSDAAGAGAAQTSEDGISVASADDAATAPPDAPIQPDWCASFPRSQYAELERVGLSDGSADTNRAESDDDGPLQWFEVYRVGDGVFALYEPHQWQEVISYLIVGSERALLVDSGLGIAPIRPVVERLLSQTGSDLPIMVLNTHSHYDHIGGNHQFDTVIARDTPFTRARTRGLPNPEVRSEVEGEALCAPLPAGVTADDFSSRPFAVDRWIGETAMLDLGERQLEVIAIPGHSPDSLAILERRSGYLWVGDSFYEGPVWLFDHGTDLAAYSHSVERLAELSGQVTRVFAGHNTPIVDPGRLVELRDAFHAVVSGEIEGTVRPDGIASFDFDAFSLLIKPADLTLLGNR